MEPIQRFHAYLLDQGAKVGLYKKCGEDLGMRPEKLTGLEFNLLSIIDNLVNGEYYLPPGEKEELYALVRDVASGYTILGTTYQYNGQNQLMKRHNLVRDEVHTYAYDSRGNMTSNGRTTFTWDDENRLQQALFPDHEGVRYTYDAMGRRTSRTTFNAQDKGHHTTYYEYEGASWNVARERNKDGEVISRPLNWVMGGIGGLAARGFKQLVRDPLGQAVALEMAEMVAKSNRMALGGTPASGAA